MHFSTTGKKSLWWRWAFVTVAISRSAQNPQAFSDGTVQAPVLLTHCHPVAIRNFVNVHGNLHHRSIQRAEGVQEFVNVVRWVTVRAQLSPSTFLWLGHRISSGVN
jgi:hypothetical protein